MSMHPSEQLHYVEEEASYGFRPMESESECVVCWCDLPPELLAIIAGQTPSDIILFRSVCRSWRSSLPPLPDNRILSPLFPLTISFHVNPEPTHVTANAVYLLRHRRDDSKVWMLSVQESSPGKLNLQHPLTYQTIPGSSGNILDLSEWRVTQIDTSYTYNGEAWRHLKVVLLSTATALCGYRNSLWAFSTEEEKDIYASQLSPFVNRGEIEDFVSFNGWIYLVEAHNRDILMFDHKTRQLFGIDCGNLRRYLITTRHFAVRFVVSDGDLYIVIKSLYLTPNNYLLEDCQVYRLVRDDMNVPTCCKWERVKDLEDRVFFINKHCSFSVSASDLPPPWKGNCVLFSVYDGEDRIHAWDLGAAEWQYWDQLRQGYFDLFSPPAGLLHPGVD